uniref:Uncharacterized protein n=1 Tax=Panagrolaimus superbus TaxID=310955 RepID=A0A914Y8I1_9BILA
MAASTHGGGSTVEPTPRVAAHNVQRERRHAWRGAIGSVESGQHRIRGGGGTHRLALRGQIGSEHAIIQHGVHRRFHRGGFCFQPQRMAQQHRRAEDRRVRIGDALAGDVRGRTMDRLVDADRTGFAERGRGQQAQRAGQHRRLIGEDVAEHVLGDDHVVLARLGQQVHRHRIDQLVFQCHVRELLAPDACRHVTPQARGFQHVGLVHAGHVAATLLRQTERTAQHALDLGHGVAAQVAGAVGIAGLVAEVDAAAPP